MDNKVKGTKICGVDVRRWCLTSRAGHCRAAIHAHDAFGPAGNYGFTAGQRHKYTSPKSKNCNRFSSDLRLSCGAYAAIIARTKRVTVQP